MAEPLAQSVVQPAIDTQHVAYCPTMDLIALATVDGQTHIYRLNRQRVFGVSNRQQSGRVNYIQWKPDGRSLAVALNGHELGLADSHTGKLFHQIDCSKYSKSPISCLGWGITLNESGGVSKRLKHSISGATLDDVISRNPSIKSIEAPPDLPLDLTFLDVEDSLPKLSPLSSGGIEDDIFSSRASMDSVFQPLSTGSTDSADVLIVGFEDGTVHLSIYDFFEIGTFNVLSTSQDTRMRKPLMHCSHPFSTTHALLASIGEDLKVVPIDLRLISNAGRYLSSLASKATQMQNILRYLRQVQKQLHGDFKASQDLPKRFIGNIEEDLKLNSDSTWEQAAYHLAVTGHCYPEVKEWLVDQLGERGYKRWDKAIVTGYETVRRLIHEHLLPALERLTVLVSRLRGLSRFQVSNATLGLSTQDLNNVLDTVGCLQLVGHHLLIATNTELHQFHAFSEWLHHEIDTQSTDATTAEGPDKGPNIDHVRTLEYIRGAMMQSRLTAFLQPRANADESPQWDLNSESQSLFDLYTREIPHEDKSDTSKQLPGLDVLLGHLDSLCSIVFTKIGETQKRNVRFGPPISLSNGVPHCMDLRMIIDGLEKKDGVCLYIAVGPRLRRAIVQIYKITFQIENGISSTRCIECASLRTDGWSIKDIKFVDDEDVLIAASNNTTSCLFRLMYRQCEALKYETANEAQEGACSVDFSESIQSSQYMWLEFPPGVSWAPERLVVNGRRGRRVVCVFAQDKFHYRVYDLDGSGGVGEEAGQEGDAESDTVMRD